MELNRRVNRLEEEADKQHSKGVLFLYPEENREEALKSHEEKHGAPPLFICRIVYDT